MNIKDWKQFSDAVDNSFTKAVSEYSNYVKKSGFDYRVAAALSNKASAIRELKTEVNFWEWKAKKLKLRI